MSNHLTDWNTAFVAAALLLPLDVWSCTRRGARTVAARLHELPPVLWFSNVDAESVRAIAWFTLPFNVGVVLVAGWMTAVQRMA